MTLHRSSTGDVQLGPFIMAMVTIEEELAEALLDTGSPVTIICTTGGPFGYFGKAASSRSDTVPQWKTMVESCLNQLLSSYKIIVGIISRQYNKLRLISVVLDLLHQL